MRDSIGHPSAADEALRLRDLLSMTTSKIFDPVWLLCCCGAVPQCQFTLDVIRAQGDGACRCLASCPWSMRRCLRRGDDARENRVLDDNSLRYSDYIGYMGTEDRASKADGIASVQDRSARTTTMQTERRSVLRRRRDRLKSTLSGQQRQYIDTRHVREKRDRRGNDKYWNAKSECRERRQEGG